MILDNLMFSVSTVLPICIMILFGYAGTRFGILEKSMMSKLARITFTWFLSVKIGLSTYDMDFEHIPAVGMLVYCVSGLLVFFVVIWAAASVLLKRKESVGSFVHCATRGAITVFGLALTESLSGEEGVLLCTPLVLFGSIENNLFAVLCLQKHDAGSSGGKVLLRAVLEVIKNPMVVGAAAGYLANIVGLPCPAAIRAPLEYLGSLAVPLSLLCIGSALSPQSVKKSFSYAMGAALIKSFGMAVIAVPVAVLLGFRGTELAIIGFFFSLANPSGCYVMTLAMDGDADLAASATVLSTLLCILSVSIMLYLLRMFALI